MTSNDLYHSNDEIFKRFSIKENLFVHYNCPQRDKILQLYSDHNQLLFTLSGKKIFRHGDDTFYANKNSTFLLKRSAFLQELPDDYTGFEVLVFYMSDSYLKLIFEEYRPFLPLDDLPELTDTMFIQVKISEQIYSSYQSLLPYFEKKHDIPDSIIEARFKELIYNIISLPENRQILVYLNKISNEEKIPIYEVMESNYMFHLKLEDYAKLAQRSLAKFKREFELHYHTSPGKWLVNRRLKKAELLLRTSSKPIGDVAFESGFVNLSHFSRAFKEHYGDSPLQYREKNQHF